MQNSFVVSTYLSRTKYRSKAPWQELSSSSSCSSGSALADGEESKNNPNKTRTRRMFNKNLAIVFPLGEKIIPLWMKRKKNDFSAFLHPRDSLLRRQRCRRQKKGYRRCFHVSLVWSSVYNHDHSHPGQNEWQLHGEMLSLNGNDSKVSDILESSCSWQENKF